MEKIQKPGSWAIDVGDLYCRLHAEGAFPDGVSGVMLVRKAAGTVFCGIPLADGMLVSFPAGSEMDFSVTPGFSYVGTQFPVDSWMAAQFLESGIVKDDLSISVRRLSASHIAQTSSRFARAMRLLRAAASGSTEAVDPSTVIQDHIADLAKDAADSDDAPFDRYSKNAFRVAASARDWIYANISEQIRIPDLCVAVGVRRRNLEYAFRLVYGVSPQEFIQAVRLNEIHRALACIRSGDRSVTDIALDYGINHFGRFAASYRTLFGELPRETRLAAKASRTSGSA